MTQVVVWNLSMTPYKLKSCFQGVTLPSSLFSKSSVLGMASENSAVFCHSWVGMFQKWEVSAQFKISWRSKVFWCGNLKHSENMARLSQYLEKSVSNKKKYRGLPSLWQSKIFEKFNPTVEWQRLLCSRNTWSPLQSKGA